MSIYREIFKSRDFIRIVIGGTLIPMGYYLNHIGFPGEIISNQELFLSLLGEERFLTFFCSCPLP
jgi:hypothetical protein